MPMRRFRFKRRIYVGIFLALAVTATWWWWSREMTSSLARTAPGRSEPFVQVAGRGGAGADKILQERADFFDPTPLFVPTPRNFGRDGLPLRLRRQPGQVFSDFGAKLSFGDGGLATYGAEVLAAPEGVVEILGQANEAPFAGFGESGAGQVALSPRGGLVVVRKLDEDFAVRVDQVESEPPRRDFGPMEFLVAISPMGLIGDPLLTAGSGRETVDTFFRNYLVQTYRVGERLAPGRYRVLIGP